MKTKHEINERIKNLKSSERNGCDNSVEINILESALLLTKEQIASSAKNQLGNKKYKELRVSIWLLEPELNIGFN